MGTPRPLRRLHQQQSLDQAPTPLVPEHWARTRELAVCVDCGARPVDLHHLDYGNLGDKDYDALLPLCRRDHDRIHAAWEATPHVRRLGRRTATLDVVAEMRIRLGR